MYWTTTGIEVSSWIKTSLVYSIYFTFLDQDCHHHIICTDLHCTVLLQSFSYSLERAFISFQGSSCYIRWQVSMIPASIYVMYLLQGLLWRSYFTFEAVSLEGVWLLVLFKSSHLSCSFSELNGIRDQLSLSFGHTVATYCRQQKICNCCKSIMVLLLASCTLLRVIFGIWWGDGSELEYICVLNRYSRHYGRCKTWFQIWARPFGDSTSASIFVTCISLWAPTAVMICIYRCKRYWKQVFVLYHSSSRPSFEPRLWTRPTILGQSFITPDKLYCCRLWQSLCWIATDREGVSVVSVSRIRIRTESSTLWVYCSNGMDIKSTSLCRENLLYVVLVFLWRF